MGSGIRLFLREDFLRSEAIWLESEKYCATPREDFEAYGPSDYPCDFLMSVHRVTGRPLVICIEGFKRETEKTISALRERPLPWRFTLDSFGFHGSPLEDILFAIWKKYEDLPMSWEED